MAESVSSVYVATAPDLVGVWVFDPLDPESTERQYLFADARTESVGVAPTELILVGRDNPLVEYGEVTLVGLTFVAMVPFGSEHDAAVEWWRTALSNRRAVCYRDGRKRLVWAALNGDLSIADGRAGTGISISLRRIDFDESVE